MGKISPRKFSLEDFPSAPAWMGAFLSTLNQFIQEVYSGTQNNVTVEDNLYREIKELKFTLDSATYPISFKPKWNVNPKGMAVIYCLASDGTSPSTYPWISYSMTSKGLIEISAILGLTSGKTYSIRMEIIYG